MSDQIIILPDQLKGWLTVKEATVKLGYTQSGYTRTLIGKGKLKAVKVMVGNRPQWYVEPTSIDTYIANKGVFAAPTDFRRCIFRFKSAELSLVQIRKALTKNFGEAGGKWTLELAHKSKGKGATGPDGAPESIVAYIMDEITEEAGDDDLLYALGTEEG